MIGSGSRAMQDSCPAFQQVPMAAPTRLHFPEHERLTCPRCESTNTKFCYFNNYNLSQPRHFCKSCKRYWTKGGSLRNIPVGGTTHKPSKKINPAKKPGPGPHPKPDWQLAEGCGGSGPVVELDPGSGSDRRNDEVLVVAPF